MTSGLYRGDTWLWNPGPVSAILKTSGYPRQDIFGRTRHQGAEPRLLCAEKVGDDVPWRSVSIFDSCAKIVFSIAATAACCLAGACASALRIQWTRQR